MESQIIDKLQKNQASKPGFFYGYIIVIVSFMVVMMGWGIFSVYGVFFNPLTDEFGWPRAVTSAAYSISVLVSGAMGIVAGRLSDRFGSKKVIMVCAIVLALGYALMSLVHSVWQFFVLYGLVIGTGLCGSWSPPLAAVAHWFVGRRGLMTGIVTGGISIGTLIMAPAVTHLISVYGWRISYIVVGIAILIIMTIAAQYFRQSPGETKFRNSALPSVSGISEGASLSGAVRTRSFWSVCIIYLYFGVALFTIMVHIVPEAIGIGISPLNAAVILSIIGITGMVGRITFGSMTDRLRVKTAIIISLILLTVSLLWLQQANNLWKLYVFAVVFGFGYGGISCIQSLLAVELFGLTSVGVITAIFSFATNLGGAVGPVLAGYIFDVSGSYKWAFLICLILVAVALIISFSLRPPRKTGLI